MKTATQKVATRKDVLRSLAREFREGKHQVLAQDLPFEIQFRTSVSWGAALSYANDIRTGKIKG